MTAGSGSINNENDDQFNAIIDNALNGTVVKNGSRPDPVGSGYAGGAGPNTPGSPETPCTPNRDKQTLSDITRGIQYAVNSAQDILEQHYVRILGKYFDKRNNPKMVNIKVPPDSTMEVPLIALVSPNGMYLDELTLDMSLRVDETEVKKIPRRDGRSIERTSFAISVGGPKKKDETLKDSDQIDIRMVFKSVDPPEGVARIVDEFTKKIIPHKTVPKLQTEQDKWQI